jgi:hypothetical protein
MNLNSLNIKKRFLLISLICILYMIMHCISLARIPDGDADISIAFSNDGFPSEGDISINIKSGKPGVTSLHYRLSYNPKILHFQETQLPVRPIFTKTTPSDRTIRCRANEGDSHAEISVASVWGFDQQVEYGLPYNLHDLRFLVTGAPEKNMDFSFQEAALTASMFSYYEYTTTPTLYAQQLMVNPLHEKRPFFPYTGDNITAKKGEIIAVSLSINTTGTLEAAFGRLIYDTSNLQLRHLGQERIEGSTLAFSNDLGTTTGLVKFALIRTLPWEAPQMASPLMVAFFEVTGEDGEASKIDFIVDKAYTGMPSRQRIFVETANINLTVSPAPEIKFSILPPDDPEKIRPGIQITLPVEIEWEGPGSPSAGVLDFQWDPDFMNIDNIRLVETETPFDQLKYSSVSKIPGEIKIAFAGDWNIDTQWEQPLRMIEILGTIKASPPQSTILELESKETWISGSLGRNIATASDVPDSLELSLFITPTPTPTPSPTPSPTPTPTPTPMPDGIYIY